MTGALRERPGELAGARDFALHRLAADAAQTTPDTLAMVGPAGAVTYGELEARARRVAHALRADGVGTGTRVAYLAEDVGRCLEVAIGTAQASGVAVPVNWRLSAAEVAGILLDSRAPVLVTTAGSLAALSAEPGALAVVRVAVLLDEPSPAPVPPAGVDVRVVGYEAWTADQPSTASDAHHDVKCDPQDVALQIYTSGTTGRPKGVMLTGANLAASLPEICQMWQLDASSRMLAVLPLFHIAGVGAAIGTLYAGATLVVPERVTAAAMVDAIAAHGVTNLVLASVLLQWLLDEVAARRERGEAVPLASLRLVAYGAAPISQQVLRDALQHLPCGLLQVYGLTECVGTIAVLQPEDHTLGDGGTERLRSCGRPLPTLELRLVDSDSGAVVDPGDVGEVQIRSPRVMAGYWNLPDETAETVTPDGWLRTGDLAQQDDQGYLYLCDRLKDMVVTGGENVYPAEVEDVLQWHPGVAEVAVVGIPDPRWGETLKALVVRTPGTAATEPELVAFAREHLAHYKCPSSVDFLPTLPRNATGKVLRRMLREPFWEGRTRRVN